MVTGSQSDTDVPGGCRFNSNMSPVGYQSNSNTSAGYQQSNPNMPAGYQSNGITGYQSNSNGSAGYQCNSNERAQLDLLSYLTKVENAQTNRNDASRGLEPAFVASNGTKQGWYFLINFVKYKLRDNNLSQECFARTLTKEPTLSNKYICINVTFLSYNITGSSSCFQTAYGRRPTFSDTFICRKIWNFFLYLCKLKSFLLIFSKEEFCISSSSSFQDPFHLTIIVANFCNGVTFVIYYFRPKKKMLCFR